MEQVWQFRSVSARFCSVFMVMSDPPELMAALAQLAAKQRAVVVLRYYEDLTERQTAEVLGVSVGTVKSQHRDALARLRVLLPEFEPAAG